MKFIKYSLMYLLLAIGLSLVSYSQDIEITINDTTIQRGGSNRIPIYFQSKSGLTGDIEFIFNYNAYVINIKDTNLTAPTNPFIDDVKMFNDLSDISNAKLTIKAKFIGSLGLAGGGFYLEVEGLAGADTLTQFTPISVILDGNRIEDTKFNSATIIVRSSSVVPGITEGLGLNRPNPFSDYTSFNIGLNKESTIHFSIFSLGGRKVLDQDNLLEAFRISLINESGENITNFNTNKIPRGNYKLTIQPYSWMLSAGAYAIILTTESGVYKTNFMYIK